MTIPDGRNSRIEYGGKRKRSPVAEGPVNSMARAVMSGFWVGWVGVEVVWVDGGGGRGLGREAWV
jgi:hypothetical protein